MGNRTALECHYVASIDGTSALLPGQAVTFEVAACNCAAPASRLHSYDCSINSRVTTKEDGFQVTTGSEKLRVKVAAGTAIGWEAGSPMWTETWPSH